MCVSLPPPVLRFPPRRRAVKAALRPRPPIVAPPDIRREVQQLIALAPVLGKQNPDSVPSVVRYVRNLIPDPPPPEREAHEPCALAAHFPMPVPPQIPAPGGLDQAHFLLSPELNVFMVSDTLEQATGLRQQEFRRHWRDYLEAADNLHLQCEFEHALATQEGFSERVHWRTADGGLIGSWLRITPRMFHDHFAGFTGVIVFDRAACA